MANEFVARKGIISLGSVTVPYVSVTSSYSILSDDYVIDATSGTFSITLPSAIGIQGKIYQIKNSGNGVITVDGSLGQTIDGSLTVLLYENDVNNLLVITISSLLYINSGVSYLLSFLLFLLIIMKSG